MSALLATALLLQVQVRQEPKDWKLIETSHFRVYYPSDDLLPRARQFAGWFEDMRVELVARLKVEPPVLNVFLYTSFHDLQQSSFLGRYRPLHERVRAEAFDDRPAPAGPKPCSPRAHSRALALAEPLRDRIFIHCQASDRWNYWFAKHELVHHMQYAHLYPWRLPSWLITLKDPIIPAWWWEGGADYFAGAFDSHKDEFVRDLAAEGLYDLKILHTPDILNPHDFLAIYHEGAYFWKFLEEAYGPDMPVKLFARTDHGLPIASQKPLQAVTGKPRTQVEREFAAHWNARWSALLAGRGEPSERITDSREYYRRRTWGGRVSPDGARLAWISDHDVWPNLVVDGRPVLAGDRGNTGARIVSPPTWSPDGRRLAVVEQINHHDRLALVGLDGRVEILDLPFDEIYDPAWSPDGRRIAFAAMKHGTADLYAVALDGGAVERLTEDPHGDLMPAWSKDGRLCWIKDVEGRTVLHVLGKGAVTRSWALLEYPRWSPDGTSIVLAADVGGVYDAFAVDPDTGKAKRLTRLRGGVRHPEPHPDGSLVITYFQGRGTDLWRVRPEPQDEPAFDQEERKDWYDRFKSPEPRGEPAVKSRVWGVDFLQFPVISQSLTTPGLEFLFGDRDAENTLSLFGTFAGSDAWAATATVVNTRWRPTIGAAAGAFGDDDLRELSARGFVEFPLWTTLAVGGGWAVRDRTQLEDDFDDPSFFDSGPFASVLYSNREGYQRRDDAWGVAFGGTATFFEDDLGGDRDQTEYFAFGETSFDLVAQDLILWTRVTYEKLVAEILLREELLDVDRLVRGADSREGIERGSVSVELRFPIWRDVLWMPLELIGLGEWLVLKDLRGFAFGQAGYAGFDFENAWDDDFGVASAGLGLRLDLSAMAWPVVNIRVPLRLEGWWAAVGEDGEGLRGEAGVGLSIGL